MYCITQRTCLFAIVARVLNEKCEQIFSVENQHILGDLVKNFAENAALDRIKSDLGNYSNFQFNANFYGFSVR
jgi:hypothetical protein